MKKRASQPAGPFAVPYWEATREPLYCLLFLFPLVVIYELGALLLRPEAWPEQRLVAQRLIQQLAAWFGTDAVWVPGVALLVTLLIWHFSNRKPWRVRGRVPLLMIFESLALTLPLFVLGKLAQPTSGGGPGAASVESLRVQVVLALGAGVYEELVFRFYLISGLRRLLTGACHVPKQVATLAALVAAALLFAACHLQPIGSETFAWPLFLMLTAAGGYLSIIFVLRGLGVSTGCHAAFNLISLALSTG
ncbi:MAG: type II CAAX prenyl endopeptidase Rce1 family protein [Phycisphaerae bacterium]